MPSSVPLHFVIAANFRLKELAQKCVQSIESQGYEWTAFDLGGLGFGRQFAVTDETFQTHGHYQTEFKRRRTTGMHKPDVVAEMLNQVGGPLVYLDADTQLVHRIDEIIGEYDVGVTVRPFLEQVRWGPINAGVIFFNPTPGAKFFVERWRKETVRVGNDQEALTNLLAGRFCRVAEFPVLIYNWYYFPDAPPPSAKILHLKVSRSMRDSG